MSTRNSWVRLVTSSALLIALLMFASIALAAGRVQWTKTTVTETDSKSWKLEIKIFLNRAPDVAHIPVKFEFSPVAYFERAMMDGDKLVERRVPLVGQQDIIEGVEVGFMDPGTGKIEKGTKFSFKLTRAHGFEAGEYKVSVRDSRNGQLIGAPTTLKFEGENEIIDRRAMVFADPKSKKEKEAAKKAAEEKEAAGGGGEGGEEKKEEPAAKEPVADPVDEPTPEKPGEVKEKPGGCGCRLANTRNEPAGGLALGLLGLGLLAARRQRHS
jgi:MYXO-CTERM domain-containing protein